MLQVFDVADHQRETISSGGIIHVKAYWNCSPAVDLVVSESGLCEWFHCGRHRSSHVKNFSVPQFFFRSLWACVALVTWRSGYGRPTSCSDSSMVIFVHFFLVYRLRSGFTDDMWSAHSFREVWTVLFQSCVNKRFCGRVFTLLFPYFFWRLCYRLLLKQSSLISIVRAPFWKKATSESIRPVSMKRLYLVFTWESVLEVSGSLEQYSPTFIMQGQRRSIHLRSSRVNSCVILWKHRKQIYDFSGRLLCTCRSALASWILTVFLFVAQIIFLFHCRCSHILAWWYFGHALFCSLFALRSSIIS